MGYVQMVYCNQYCTSRSQIYKTASSGDKFQLRKLGSSKFFPSKNILWQVNSLIFYTMVLVCHLSNDP